MPNGSVRGVFRCEYLSEEGFPLLVAVRSDGSRLVERRLFPFEDESRVINGLWDLLDAEDPVRRQAA